MKITQFLQQRNVEFDLISHPGTHDAQRLAATIHVSGHEVAKTVLLKADAGYANINPISTRTMTPSPKALSRPFRNALNNEVAEAGSTTANKSSDVTPNSQRCS